MCSDFLIFSLIFWPESCGINGEGDLDILFSHDFRFGVLYNCEDFSGTGIFDVNAPLVTDLPPLYLCLLLI
jgi:hypothetical protein